MSVQAVAWALDATQTGHMPAEVRLVLVALADHAHPDGRAAWPKVKTLAERLGVTPRSVKRSLSWLRTAELITPGDQGLVSHLDPRYRPTVYDLKIRGAETVTPESPPERLSTRQRRRGAEPVTSTPSRGDARGSPGVTPASPCEPPVEPPLLTHLTAQGDTSARETEQTSGADLCRQALRSRASA